MATSTSSLNHAVIVTGGGQGIGREITRAFAREVAHLSQGWFVIIADMDEEAGHENEKFIGERALFVKTNVGDEASVRSLFDSLSLLPQVLVSALVNNAGLSKFVNIFDEKALDTFDLVLSVNLRGPFLLSRSFAKYVREKGVTNAAIINIASTRAFMSESNSEAYGASKGGLVALTHALAVSLGEYGIRVNSISPGWIDVRSLQKSSTLAQALPTPLTERDHKQHPVGRVGVANDIAQACLFLSNAQLSGFITGENITIDGGMTKKMIWAE